MERFESVTFSQVGRRKRFLYFSLQEIPCSFSSFRNLSLRLVNIFFCSLWVYLSPLLILPVSLVICILSCGRLNSVAVGHGVYRQFLFATKQPFLFVFWIWLTVDDFTWRSIFQIFSMFFRVLYYFKSTFFSTNSCSFMFYRFIQSLCYGICLFTF